MFVLKHFDRMHSLRIISEKQKLHPTFGTRFTPKHENGQLKKSRLTKEYTIYYIFFGLI